VLATRAWLQLVVTAVVVLCKFPLYCSIGSHGAAVTPDELICLIQSCQFAIDSVLFFVSDFSFTPLWSLVLTESLWVPQNTKG
jgi:hypothetical protein